MNRLALTTLISISIISNNTFATDDDTLLIWGARGVDQLKDIAADFERDFGIKVMIENPSEPEKQFTVVAASGKGPDIFFFAHDRYGEYVNGGLLREIKPGKEILQANSDIGWEAMKYNGITYGYPISVEAVSLVYNKDLIAQPPENFEDMYALQQQLAANGKETIAWAYSNVYFSHPLLAADGGYVYGKKNGVYDTSDVGVDSPGYIEGGRFIKQAIDRGLLAKDTDYGVMDAKFNAGKVAMMINGPWSWGNAVKNNINFGVVPLPKLNGKHPAPFVGVWGAVINANSKNPEAAVEFLEHYLLTEAGLKRWNKTGELGAVTNINYMKELAQDANIKAIAESAAYGTPMPNIPEMAKYWDAVQTAILSFTSGRQSVEDALKAAADKLR